MEFIMNKKDFEFLDGLEDDLHSLATQAHNISTGEDEQTDAHANKAMDTLEKLSTYLKRNPQK